tara:strand:- start:1385 stop:1603 length:219 start_codon:yes stop_codon:yes gene_type:complete
MTTNNLSNIGKVCPACARPIHRCLSCGEQFYPKRPEATTCSAACRAQRTYNRKNKLKSFAPGGADDAAGINA